MDAEITPLSLNVSEPARSRRGVMFGPQLAAKRGTKSINATAKAIGIAPSTLLRLERGEIGAGYDIAQKVASYHKCTVEDLRSEPA